MSQEIQERAITIRIREDTLNLMYAIALVTGQVVGEVLKTAIEKFVEEAKKDEDFIRKVEEFRRKEAEVFAVLLGIEPSDATQLQNVSLLDAYRRY